MGIGCLNDLIENLEKLRKNATPGPWLRKTLPTNPDFHFVETLDDVEFPMVFHAKKGDVNYITAACNALPLLLDELEKRERMLEYLAGELVSEDCMHPHRACPYRKSGYGCYHYAEHQKDCWIERAREEVGE